MEQMENMEKMSNDKSKLNAENFSFENSGLGNLGFDICHLFILCLKPYAFSPMKYKL